MTAVLLVAARICVAGVFAAALLAKARNRGAFRAFADSLVALRLVAPRWSTALAVGVLSVEALVVVLLALPSTARPGPVLAALVLAGFTAALLLGPGGNGTPCPCFGPPSGTTSETTRRTDVARNAVLISLAVALAISDPISPAAPGIALSAVLGLLGAALIVRSGDIAVLLRPTTVDSHR